MKKSCETCLHWFRTQEMCTNPRVGIPFTCMLDDYTHYERRDLTMEEIFEGESEDKYNKAAKEIADLVSEKQKAYGDSFGKSGKVLRELYPDGIKLEQYDDMLTIVRILDKLFRIATKKDAFGEDPFKDINGYSLLAVVKNNKDKEFGPF